MMTRPWSAMLYVLLLTFVANAALAVQHTNPALHVTSLA